MASLARTFAAVLALAACSPATQGVHAFDDCGGASWCPRMVSISGGAFMMGSPEREAGRSADEGPRRRVTLHAFALGETEITFAQWFACVDDGACDGYRPSDYSGQSDDPAVNISWRDAQAYVQWLARKTGQRYRLPSEAEWEYAARAGADTAYPWGDQPDHDRANVGADACCAGLSIGRDAWIGASPVGSFPANAFGMRDMAGNAWEWVADCYHDTYANAPNDGAAWQSETCDTRILRGGSFLFSANHARSAARRTHRDAVRTGALGFRVARDL